MSYFFETVDTIDPSLNLGFSLYGPLHLTWLAVFVLFTAALCVLYRKSSDAARAWLRRIMAGAIVLDEVFKMVCLAIGGNYTADYLPLHLCSINLFLIAIHAVKPSKPLDNFLYAVCIPGALAALLFPTWTALPLDNFMHLHSFTIHILLAAYPIVLAVGGDIRPDIKALPRSILLLLGMAAIALAANLLFDTNFMFLMYVEGTNPLGFFEQLWGNHLYGYPVLISAVIVVMYAPLYTFRALRNRSRTAHGA